MQELLGDESTPAEWEKLRPVLDDVLDQLDTRDREAILLRFYEGRPFAGVGAALRLSEDAARMRVDRALDKLRALLAKRGITSTSAALAAVLANQAAATAPVGLAATITGAALSGAAAAEAGVVAAVISFMTATKTTAVLGVATALALTTAVYQTTQARTTAATLATAGRDHAAARARLTELETQVQVAEQTLADREEAIAQLAAANATPKSKAAAAEAAKQQKALQAYLDNNPALRMLQVEARTAVKQHGRWPIFLSLGMTPEQAERAFTVIDEIWARRNALSAAGQKSQDGFADLRAACGDAAADRWIEYAGTRWDEGTTLRQVATDLYYIDEPFTAEQTKQMLGILKSAKAKGGGQGPRDWNQVLAKAEPILSPAQMQGLRAQAARARLEGQFAAATKEAAAAAKK